MYSPDFGHSAILADKPILAFDEFSDFKSQQKAIKSKLIELLKIHAKSVPLSPDIEYQHSESDFTEYRIRFAVEKNVDAICLLCIPNNKKGKLPLAICLQGHAPGMQVSLGRSYPGQPFPGGDRDFASQALAKGFAALCLEQRGMGERATSLADSTPGFSCPKCYVTAMNALLVGKTIIGERCWDISRAIDLALTFPEIDGERIICVGNSGGGTSTYYAACLDERIKVAIASCAVCTFKDSICAMPHCVCNFIPDIAKYMDMGDMAAAIAPRKLIVVNGEKDNIFPKSGVMQAFATIKKVYAAAGVSENCALVTGEEGHRFYKEKAWNRFDEMVSW